MVGGGSAELEHPRPGPAYGAELGDRLELLVGGRQPELHQARRLVDVHPGLGEGPQVVRPDREHVAQLLHVGGTEVVHGRAVDDQRAAAELTRQRRRLRDHAGSGLRAPVRPASVPTPRTRAPTGSTPRLVPAASVRAPRHRGEGAGGTQGVRRRVEHDRRHVEQHALEQGLEVGRGDTRAPHLHEERGDAVLQVGQRGCVRRARIGVGEERAHVPAVPARGGTHRVGQVGHELGRAERGDRDPVERPPREGLPDVVVGGVLTEASRLAEHRRSGRLPVRDVVVGALGQGEVRVWAHARTLGSSCIPHQSL